MMKALRKGDRTAQRATGFSGATLEGSLGGMTDDVRNIEQRLAQNKEFGRLASSGRQSGSAALQNSTPPTLPAILERNVVIANALLTRAGKKETTSVLEFLSKNLDKPQEIARLMRNASPEENQAVNSLIRHLRQAPAAATAAVGVN